MLELIIAFMNSQIATLNQFEKLRGLCILREVDGQGSRILEYMKDGEFDNEDVADFDVYKGSVYHRTSANTTQVDNPNLEGAPRKMFDRTFSIRTVLAFPKDTLDNDDPYIEEKLTENVINVVTDEINASLATAMGAFGVDFEMSGYKTDKDEIFDEEFSALDKKPSDKLGFSAIEFEVTVTASNRCFQAFSCGDVTIPDFNKCTVNDVNNPSSPVLLSANEEYTCIQVDPLPKIFNIPLTGATTIHTTSGGVDGDDAFIEQNVFAALRQTGEFVGLLNKTTLTGNNKWGNTNRITDDIGGQAYANDIVQFHELSIEVYRPLQSSANWSNYIANSLGTDFPGGLNVTLGKTDWFPFNREIMTQVADYSSDPSLGYSPMNLTMANIMWTSTTQQDDSSRAYVIESASGRFLHFAKTSALQSIFARMIDP